MEIKKQGLSQNEKYACSLKDVKALFSDIDSLYASFGYIRKNFLFDKAFTNHPRIDGCVIASVSFNKRLKINLLLDKNLNPTYENQPYLCFYVIHGDKYETKNRENFCKLILPEMRRWLDNVLIQRDNELPGIYELLVEWTGSDFKLHNCRYK